MLVISMDNGQDATVLNAPPRPIHAADRSRYAMPASESTSPKIHWRVGRKLAPEHVANAKLGRRKGLTEEEHFWARVDRRGPDECWPWRGGKIKMGYGVLAFHGHHRMATHVAWSLANGHPFPDGLLCLHSCDNPPCCNPAHLRPGDHKDNAGDAVARGRNYKGGPPKRPPATHCKNGHAFDAENTIYMKTQRRCRICLIAYAQGKGRFGKWKRTVYTPESEAAERERIVEALRRHAGIARRAAQALGLKRCSLEWKMKRHGIDAKAFKPQPSAPEIPEADSGS